MSVKWHGATGLRAMGHRTEEGRGFRHLSRFLLCVGLMGGFTEILWPHGGPAVYTKIKLTG